MRQLLIGCGENRTRHVSLDGSHEFTDLVTLDMNPKLGPDVVWNLEDPHLPFADDEFDEIHAYQILEHVGRQGDWRWFFRQWDGFWRVLKPGGRFCGLCPEPNSPWAWGDPGHTRIISRECLVFLDRTNYDRPPMTDYRPWYKGDFEVFWMSKPGSLNGNHAFVLTAVKPPRG